MAQHHIDALELIKKGEWDKSHRLIQQFDDRFAALIHGYLHKIEGDLSNAAYWYRLAGEIDSTQDHTAELTELINRAAKLP